MSDGIQFVSDVEDITKMRAAHLLIEAGFKYWMGEKVKQHIRQQLAANEQERLVRNSLIFCFASGPANSAWTSTRSFDDVPT